MLKNMKVKNRLLLGFGAIIALMAALVALDARQSSITHDKLDLIVNVNNKRIELASQMIDSARETAIEVRSVIIFKRISGNDTLKATQSRDNIRAIRKRYNEDAEAIAKLIPPEDAEGTKILAEVIASAREAEKLQDQVIALALAGKSEEAAEFMTSKAYPSVKKWIGESDDFIRYNQRRNSERFTQITDSIDTARAAMLLLGAAALLLGVFLASVLSLGISKPLALLVNAAGRVKAGNLEVDFAGEENRGDELGVVLKAFSGMTATIKESRDRLLAASAYTRNLIEASLDPLVTISPEGKITDVNKATEQVTGIARDRLVDTDFADYFTEPEKARSGYLQAFAAGSVKDYPLAIRHVSGRVTEVLYNASVYRNEAGASQGVFAAARDVTESKRLERQLAAQTWLKAGIARLNECMVGDPDLDTLSAKVISEISEYSGAQLGALYLARDGAEGVLKLNGSYALTGKTSMPSAFKRGEGLVGQAALAKKPLLIKDIPPDYVKVASALGDRTPRFICVSPFIHDGRLKGVLELGTLHELSDLHLEYISQVMPGIALAVESAENREKLAQSLAESQAQAEELQAQQEELRTSNEELEQQTQALRASEEELKAQQEELQVTNEELEEKNSLLDRQKKEVETARRSIEEQAKDLALASKYKSEFLANMSHELRTPLNSLLLLARSLYDNKPGNLAPDQVESARIIHGAGNDLLNMINEILDLSKIEAGRMDLHPAPVDVGELSEGLLGYFGHLAQERGLKLEVLKSGDAPAEIISDRKRIEQVLKNLVSNAIKFTHSGGVTVTFGKPAADAELPSGCLPESCLAIEVTDTGIGIDRQHHKRIFEAFQQVDGSIARKYGGTGLGLSISRELARLLGGDIRLASEHGKGSKFTLYLPLTAPKEAPARPVERGIQAADATPPETPGPAREPVQIADDRNKITKGDRVVLVIEDDSNFAGLLYNKCHERGLKCIAAPTGEAGLKLAAERQPAAVLLDIYLPGMNGWEVLAALKENPDTRHIPVHIISGDEPSNEAMKRGAIGQAVKPVSQEELEAAFRRLEAAWSAGPKRVLVVENAADIRKATVKLLASPEVAVDSAETAGKAMEALEAGGYDCVVLDIGLSDMDGMEMLRQLEVRGIKLPPVIIYTARDLTREQEAAFRERAEAIVLKDVRSQERLLDEVSIFLHRVVSKMPEQQRRIIRDLHNTDAVFKDKKVLIVDDDMRTTFAMSRLLAERGMKPLKAENGEKALRLLEENPDTDLVLMDVMMPVMDGYEATRRIRAKESFRKLPIIALTAKAMQEDRGKCLAAGADDYLAKPVDAERLVSMLRVWLCR